MTYTTSTPIKGTSLGDPMAIWRWADALGCARSDNVREYLTGVYTYAPTLGLAAHVIVAQSIHETAEDGVPWASDWWQSRLNPAGIGINGDPVQEAASRTFANGYAAARAHCLHLYLYAVGNIVPAGLDIGDDPRWQEAVNAGRAGIAQTIGDLTGRWGTDPEYAAGVAKWLNVLDRAGLIDAPTTTPPVPETGDTTVSTITYGRVPAPKIIKIDTSAKPAGTGWDNLGQRKPKFVVLHRMVGSLGGTDSWFANPTAPALTDFGIGIGAMDGKAKSGEIHQYNDPRGTRSGWASGPVNAAYGDGAALVAKYGINVVNRDGESLEISGNYDTPITDAEKQRIAEWIAWRWDLMRIPYTSAPINPETGISAVCWHQEFTIGTGKICPGPVVMNATDDLIARAVAILKKYQAGTDTTPEVPPTPSYLAPVDIAFQDEIGTGKSYYEDAGTIWYDDGLTYVVRPGRTAKQLVYAVDGAAETAAPLAAGTEVVGVVKGVSKSDQRPYILTPTRARVYLGDLQPKAA